MSDAVSPTLFGVMVIGRSRLQMPARMRIGSGKERPFNE
jgi:hypothetical protein